MKRPRKLMTRDEFIQTIARMTPYPESGDDAQCTLNQLIGLAREIQQGPDLADAATVEALRREAEGRP